MAIYYKKKALTRALRGVKTRYWTRLIIGYFNKIFDRGLKAYYKIISFSNIAHKWVLTPRCA